MLLVGVDGRYNGYDATCGCTKGVRRIYPETKRTKNEEHGYEKAFRNQPQAAIDPFGMLMAFGFGLIPKELYKSLNNAEEALEKLNGIVIGRQAIHLSWGRNPANKQVRADLSSQWNNAFYGGPFYGGYGYTFPPQDPAMCATAYGGYAYAVTNNK